jgi:hypothetical protein
MSGGFFSLAYDQCRWNQLFHGDDQCRWNQLFHGDKIEPNPVSFLPMSRNVRNIFSLAYDQCRCNQFFHVDKIEHFSGVIFAHIKKCLEDFFPLRATNVDGTSFYLAIKLSLIRCHFCPYQEIFVGDIFEHKTKATFLALLSSLSSQN